jgi:hypothetical protein
LASCATFSIYSTLSGGEIQKKIQYLQVQQDEKNCSFLKPSLLAQYSATNIQACCDAMQSGFSVTTHLSIDSI